MSAVVVAGGGLVPTTADSTQFNITSADLARLHSEIVASIRRSTLSSEIRHDVAEQIDKVSLLGLEDKRGQRLFKSVWLFSNSLCLLYCIGE